MVVGIEPAADPLEPTGVSRVQEALWADLPPIQYRGTARIAAGQVAGRRSSAKPPTPGFVGQPSSTGLAGQHAVRWPLSTQTV